MRRRSCRPAEPRCRLNFLNFLNSRGTRRRAWTACLTEPPTLDGRDLVDSRDRRLVCSDVLEAWCSGLTCSPVKAEIAGSNPVASATASFRREPDGSGSRRRDASPAVARPPGQICTPDRPPVAHFPPLQPDMGNPHHERRPRCYTGLTLDVTRPGLALFANAPGGVNGEPDRLLVLERFIERRRHF